MSLREFLALPLPQQRGKPRSKPQQQKQGQEQKQEQAPCLAQAPQPRLLGAWALRTPAAAEPASPAQGPPALEDAPPAAAAVEMAAAPPARSEQPCGGCTLHSAAQGSRRGAPTWAHPGAALPPWVVQAAHPPPHIWHAAHARACYEMDMWSGRAAAAAAGHFAWWPYSHQELAHINGWTAFYVGAAMSAWVAPPVPQPHYMQPWW